MWHRTEVRKAKTKQRELMSLLPRRWRLCASLAHCSKSPRDCFELGIWTAPRWPTFRHLEGSFGGPQGPFTNSTIFNSGHHRNQNSPDSSAPACWAGWRAGGWPLCSLNGWPRPLADWREQDGSTWFSRNRRGRRRFFNPDAAVAAPVHRRLLFEQVVAGAAKSPGLFSVLKFRA